MSFDPFDPFYEVLNEIYSASSLSEFGIKVESKKISYSQCNIKDFLDSISNSPHILNQLKHSNFYEKHEQNKIHSMKTIELIKIFRSITGIQPGKNFIKHFLMKSVLCLCDQNFPIHPNFCTRRTRNEFELVLNEDRRSFQFGELAEDSDGNIYSRHLSVIGEDEIEYEFRNLQWKTNRLNYFQFSSLSLAGVEKSLFNHKILLIELKFHLKSGKSILIFYTRLFENETFFGTSIRAIYFRSNHKEKYNEWIDWKQNQRIVPQLIAKFVDSSTPGNEKSSADSALVHASRICICCKIIRLKKEFSVAQWKKKGNKCLKCIEMKSNPTDSLTDEKSESEEDSEKLSESESGSGLNEILNLDYECCICLSEKSEPFESICGHSAHLLHTQCLQDWKLRCGNNFHCPICRAPPREK